MNQGHLSDDRLIELCLDGTMAPSEVHHLTACTACDARRVELTSVLTDVTTSATEEADAAFPAERLARQQARILSRIDHDGRPGRVIAFPASRAPEPVSLRTRPTTRWVAAAAAAGLFVGLVAGHFSHDLPVGTHASLRPQVVARQQIAGTSMREASMAITDDEFLGEVEQAIDSSGPAALRPIDALTPRAWDVR
jgi:hypothetical protein